MKRTSMLQGVAGKGHLKKTRSETNDLYGEFWFLSPHTVDVLGVHYRTTTASTK